MSGRANCSVERLIAAWEAEIAEERRLARLPDTISDTALIIEARAAGRADCVADLRATLAEKATTP
jgi:hypothetical protein